jgi:ketosteroid isomerase-like protein
LKTIYEQAANEGKPELLKPYLDLEFSGVMVTGDEVDSFDSLEKYWAKIQKLLGEGGKYHVKVDVPALSILSGDLAVAHGTTVEEVTTSRGKQYNFTGRWTAVCRKREGQWKVLRIQGSMDPIANPFVLAAVSSASLFAGTVAGIAGLVVGWLAHLLLFRHRKTAPST